MTRIDRRPATCRATVLALGPVVLALMAPGGVFAAPARQSAAEVRAIAACAALTEDAARLACYDKTARALVEAEKTGDVVIVDQAQVKEVKRQSFGFNINVGPLFDRPGRTEQVMELVTAVDGAWQSGEGKWLIRTAEGQVWRQIDGESLFASPKKGDKVVIRHGSLGSYFLKVGTESSIRAHRDE
jgi:hypothetical protein